MTEKMYCSNCDGARTCHACQDDPECLHCDDCCGVVQEPGGNQEAPSGDAAVQESPPMITLDADETHHLLFLAEDHAERCWDVLAENPGEATLQKRIENKLQNIADWHRENG